MIKKQLFLILMTGAVHSTIFYNYARENASETADIKCNVEIADSDKNPLEQLIDYFNSSISYPQFRERFAIWVSTPDRSAPLIQANTENGKLQYIEFKIPYRIDMSTKYSEQINEAVKTRQELPFVAYNFVRNVPQDETVTIPLRSWILYNARMANAGKHGYWLCYNTEKENTENCGCMSMAEFAECLKFYKPNGKENKTEQHD